MKFRVLGAILLISGTSIGAGMLALPIATAPMGFLYSTIALILIWLVMCYTGLLVIEANLWFPRGTNYISMAGETLGLLGQIFTWLLFLLLLYALLAAYITAGGALIKAALSHVGIVKDAVWMSDLPWILFFLIVIYSGLLISDWVNRFLMIGLIASFAALTVCMVPHLHFKTMNYTGHFSYIFWALPILFASFGYHVVLPSARDYLDHHERFLLKVVVIGSFISVCVYVVWELLVFGALSGQGKNSLLQIFNAKESSDAIVSALIQLTHIDAIHFIARFFVFFAIGSSFLGVSVGLFDLIADGFSIPKTVLGRAFIAVLTFVPPMLFAFFYPQGFLLALSAAGVFVALLHGVLPVLMVWIGRKDHPKASVRIWGGDILFTLILAISFLVIASQVLLLRG